MAISVAICTHNRSASLRRCLESLHAADHPCCEWNVLVVMNNCTDDTHSVVQDFENKIPIRCVMESRHGLSAARNRAISESPPGLLLFTDDDVAVDKGWLSAYESAAFRWPDASFFGGAVIPFFVEGRPAWLTDELGKGILGGVCMWRCVPAVPQRVFGIGEMPWGANFAIRVPVPFGLLFREDLGFSGTALLPNEETDFLQRLVKAGASGIIVGSAVVYHTTPAYRLRVRYIMRHAWGRGRADVRCGFATMPQAANWALWWPNWHIREVMKKGLSFIIRIPLLAHGERMAVLYDQTMMWGRIWEWTHRSRR